MLRMCSNLIVKGYLMIIVLDIWRRGYLENLKGKMSVRFDLMMVLTGVITFLVVMIVLYQKKYLLDLLPSLVHLVYSSVLPNMVVVRWNWEGYRDFHVFAKMLVLNLSSLRVYLRCCIVKGVGEFLVMYYLNFLKKLVLVIVVYRNELWGFENFYFFVDV